MRSTHASPPHPAIGRLELRSGAALLKANIRFWPSVASRVRRELLRWSARAEAIPDASLRELARAKLADEHFNSQVAATLATLAPRSHRASAVEAIVALEVMYDYLDGLTERAVAHPLQSGARLFAAFTRPFSSSPSTPADYYALQEHRADGGYLLALSQMVRDRLSILPARDVVAGTALAAAVRCAEGQVRVHTAPQLGDEQLERWARTKALEGALPWREYLAGAVASVLAVHAQITLATSSEVTGRQARALDETYLSICALSTMLDSLVDYERDLASGEPWLVRLYGGPRELGSRLLDTAKVALTQARALPDSAHHVMTLAGVIAYYTSAPQARRGVARLEIQELHSELRALIAPTLAVMRGWRLAKRAKARFR